jgi:hypothetical protein
MVRMFMLLAAALASSTPPPSTVSRPVGAVAQATATIRIVSGIVLKLDSPTTPGAPPSRDTVVRTADGSSQPAKLIEFE